MQSGDTDAKNLELVVVDEEVQALDSIPNPEIKEILQLSLEGIKVVDGEMVGSSLWVMQNIQKFTKVMVSHSKLWKSSPSSSFLKLKKGKC